MTTSTEQNSFLAAVQSKYSEVLLVGCDRKTGAIDIIHQLKPHSIVTSKFQQTMHKIYGRLAKTN